MMWEAEAGGFQVWGQSGMHGETLSLKTNNNNNETTNNNRNMEETPQTHRNSQTWLLSADTQYPSTVVKAGTQRQDLISLVY